MNHKEILREGDLGRLCDEVGGTVEKGMYAGHQTDVCKVGGAELTFGASGDDRRFLHVDKFGMAVDIDVEDGYLDVEYMDENGMYVSNQLANVDVAWHK